MAPSIVADAANGGYITYGNLPPLAAGMYVTRLDPTTSQWVHATALPTLEGVSQLATDPYGNTYLAGTQMGGPEAVFVAKLNAADQLQWLTREANLYDGDYGGGPMWESAGGLAVDSWGNVFIAAKSACLSG